MHTYASLEQLLLATVQKHIHPTATIVNYVQLPSGTGISKINVQRFVLHLSDGQSVVIITKPSPLIERRVLARLNEQHHAIVPFSHSLNLTDSEALICLQDAGSPIVPTEDNHRVALADGLAKIHLANIGKESELAWLPKAERAYFADFILGWTWRLAWERALEDANFVKQFADYIPKVQSSAKTFPDAMQTLYDDAQTRTLIHTDIYAGHVLAKENQPFIIDWGQTHYGSFYLDLPSYFDTPENAEIYRLALEKHGMGIPKNEFLEKYHIAGRFVGFRYMWGWIEEWRKHPADANEQGVIYMLEKAIGE